MTWIENESRMAQIAGRVCNAWKEINYNRCKLFMCNDKKDKKKDKKKSKKDSHKSTY